MLSFTLSSRRMGAPSSGPLSSSHLSMTATPSGSPHKRRLPQIPGPVGMPPAGPPQGQNYQSRSQVNNNSRIYNIDFVFRPEFRNLANRILICEIIRTLFCRKCSRVGCVQAMGLPTTLRWDPAGVDLEAAATATPSLPLSREAWEDGVGRTEAGATRTGTTIRSRTIRTTAATAAANRTRDQEAAGIPPSREGREEGRE